MEYNYDSEADVLSITLSNIPFDYAEEMGDFIVHFSKKNKPVYVEILNASKFIKNAAISFPRSSREEIIRQIHAV